MFEERRARCLIRGGLVRREQLGDGSDGVVGMPKRSMLVSTVGEKLPGPIASECWGFCTIFERCELVGA